MPKFISYVFTLFDSQCVRHDFVEILSFPVDCDALDATVCRLKSTCGFAVASGVVPTFREIGRPFDCI